MKLVVIGGHSRSIGKTSLAASIIAASADLHWTALKITQYGHGVCSSSGHDCGCRVEEPDCPYAIDRELNPGSGSDTSRFLKAGASEVYWVRTRIGELDLAIPAMNRLLADREFVIMESNSILRFLNPDIYIPVLHFGIEDFKLSSKMYLNRAGAYAIVANSHDVKEMRPELSAPGRRDAPGKSSEIRSAPEAGHWPGVDLGPVQRRPAFPVSPPSYCSPEIVEFVRQKLGAQHQLPTP